MRCTKCGSDNREGAKFCSECATAFQSEKEKTRFATFSEVKFKLRPIRSGAKLCRAQALLPVLRRLYGGRR
jgi:uncharacterized membrane protein YvbJ